MYLNCFQFTFGKSVLRGSFMASSKLSRPNLKDAWDTRVNIESNFYHNSPSRKVSAGRASKTSCGRTNWLLFRESIAFLWGFQKPRIPSYFSNIHLEGERHKHIHRKAIKLYQWDGFVLVRVRKHAVMGSPIPSTLKDCLSKNFAGGSFGIGSALPIFACVNKSGRTVRIVAVKLHKYL